MYFLRQAKCHSFVLLPQPQTWCILFWQQLSTLLFYQLPFIYPVTSKKKKKKPCIVNSLCNEVKYYRALSTTLFTTINDSSPLHPSHTFITLVEMSNVFTTVITPWWPWGFGRCSITKDITFLFLGALCCTAEYLNQWCLNIHAIHAKA